ncbi:hypothetical protein LZC95_11765 [Pendulispora brunnea]|uniref:Lipoprotein n=1 Tax=Pendulispora brunnea TaxID=2905690 RepID=A0ABZ2KIU1_9BACT
MKGLFAVLAFAMPVVACVGTTGSDLITFRASAAGPADVTAPLVINARNGYQVTLTRARMHIGALYLNQSVPISGSQETSCVLPGIYLAQVTGGLDVDLLSPAPQSFPVLGEAFTGPAATGEVWLFGNTDINAAEDTTPILNIEGTAQRGGVSYPFRGTFTIGKNRNSGSTDPSRPGANPICKQRIVSPVSANLLVEEGGSLVVRIDPRRWFDATDFSLLQQVQTSPPLYSFDDQSANQASQNLYSAFRSRVGVYSFSWIKESSP